MPVTPSSSAALAVAGARDLIAASTINQSYIELHHPTATDPLDHIYLHDVAIPDGDLTMADLRPFVLVTLQSNSYAELFSCSVTNLKLSGGVIVAFFDTARETDDDADSYLDFLNWMYGTLDQMSGLFGADTNYPFTSIEEAIMPERSNRIDRETDDFWHGVVVFHHDREPAG